MVTIAAAEVCSCLASVIEMAQTEAVIIEQRGADEAVIISGDEYDWLLECAEEIDDIAAFDESVSEPGPNIPWERAVPVRAEVSDRNECRS